MSNKRSWVWGLVVVAVAAVALYRQSVFGEPAPPPTTNIAFITGGSSPYWELTVAGAKAAANEYDAKLEVLMPEKSEDLDEQSQILINLDKTNLDGIAISPLSAESQTKLINNLTPTTPIVTFDSDAPLSTRRYYVGTSNYGAGKMCHQLIAEALPEGGKVAVLVATLTKYNNQERKTGFEEAIAESVNMGAQKPIVLAELLEDEGNAEKVGENVRQALTANEDLAGLVLMNSYHGPLVLEALKELDKLGQIKVVAFDQDDETLNGVAEGTIHATVVQDPYMYGYEAVRMLTKLHSGTDVGPIVGGGVVNVPCEALHQDDIEAFRQKTKDRMGTPEPAKSK